MRRIALIAGLSLAAGGAVAQTASVPDMPERHRELLNRIARVMAFSTVCERYPIAKDAMIAMLLPTDLDLKRPDYRAWMEVREREYLSKLRPHHKDIACALALDEYGPRGRVYPGLIQIR